MGHYTKYELQELASQLRCPHGDNGLDVANQMASSNLNMLNETLQKLEIKDNQRILEIGPGNASHVNNILSKANGLNYIGLDISELMINIAREINHISIENNQSDFILYDGVNIPFPANIFNRIFTINTLYFYENPKNFLKQIFEILEHNGLFSITFQKKSFIENLAFTKYGFNLYEIEEVKDILLEIGFIISDVVLKSEYTISKLGYPVQRYYYIIVCKK